jgi:hypothetical protein
MDQKRANWDPATTRLFLHLCIAEKEKFNFSNQGLTKDGWRNVYRSSTETAGTIFTAKHVQQTADFKKKDTTPGRNCKTAVASGVTRLRVPLRLMPSGGRLITAAKTAASRR